MERERVERESQRAGPPAADWRRPGLPRRPLRVLRREEAQAPLLLKPATGREGGRERERETRACSVAGPSPCPSSPSPPPTTPSTPLKTSAPEPGANHLYGPLEPSKLLVPYGPVEAFGLLVLVVTETSIDCCDRDKHDLFAGAVEAFSAKRPRHLHPGPPSRGRRRPASPRRCAAQGGSRPPHGGSRRREARAPPRPGPSRPDGRRAVEPWHGLGVSRHGMVWMCGKAPGAIFWNGHRERGERLRDVEIERESV